MSVLALRLAAPLQSWGVDSRFLRRGTEAAPSKSGLIGLLAAAQGRRRSDSIEDLLSLNMAARLDQPGTLLRDFHTAHRPDGGSMPLSERYYWADAVFTAYVVGDGELLEGLRQQLLKPTFPLYLGRRSCVPTGRLVLGLWHETSVHDVMTKEVEWQARRNVTSACQDPVVKLRVQADAELFPDMAVSREMRDVPRSFDPEHRQYGLRSVVETTITVLNPAAAKNPTEDADPFFTSVLEASR